MITKPCLKRPGPSEPWLCPPRRLTLCLSQKPPGSNQGCKLAVQCCSARAASDLLVSANVPGRPHSLRPGLMILSLRNAEPSSCTPSLRALRRGPGQAPAEGSCVGGSIFCPPPGRGDVGRGLATSPEVLVIWKVGSSSSCPWPCPWPCPRPTSHNDWEEPGRGVAPGAPPCSKHRS